LNGKAQETKIMKYKIFKIMGIINATPDSFSDGGSNLKPEDALKNVEEMIIEGADIIDIGGESSRPNSLPVSLNEEIDRVVPIIKAVKKEFPQIPISIDTTKFEVAKIAINEGATIINDISGLQFEPRFAELAAANNVGLVIMHIQGNPKTMQVNPVYQDVVEEVYSFLDEKIKLAQSFGVKKIWADVGIGFGKNYSHNIDLLKNLDKFHNLQTPLLLGISRKSFIGKMLGIENPVERDLATTLIHSLLLSKGVDILRVHNVKYLQTLRKIILTF
jgi:dihydropteroate synthase